MSMIETETMIAVLRDDGIMHISFKPNTHITVEAQEEMVKTYWQLTDIKRPFLFEGGDFVSVSIEARRNALFIEDQTPVLASAILVKNLGQRIIADYYYKVFPPKYPLKVFRSFDEGIAWLHQLEK